MSNTFLVVGEALTDCVIRGDLVTETPGGSPLNVAIGIGRLGHDVVLAARVGSDSRGQIITQHVLDSGVTLIDDVSGLPRTSTASATIAEDGSASYVFDLLWDITPAMIPNQSFAHVHIGSIGATLEPGSTGVVEIVSEQRAAGASISYDPNARPSIMGDPEDVRARIEELIALSHIVKASDEDIAWLYPGRNEDEALTSWRDGGASLVVVTKGAEGVLAMAGDHTVTRSTRATAVEDTIGAGDSFMAGLLVALQRRALVGSGVVGLSSISREELEASVDFALECAAITVSRVGANPPTQDDLDAWLL
jgi:fructokinase